MNGKRLKTPMYMLIINACYKKQLTVHEFANYVPMQKSSYYAFLRGKKRLTLQEANTISGELDIPLDLIAKAELESLC